MIVWRNGSAVVLRTIGCGFESPYNRFYRKWDFWLKFNKFNFQLILLEDEAKEKFFIQFFLIEHFEQIYECFFIIHLQETLLIKDFLFSQKSYQIECRLIRQ